jgi:voltage-gated potassium channel
MKNLGLPSDVRARLVRFGVILPTITIAGTWGYMYLEGWNFFDSLYMTVITLSTVGFSEVSPLSPEGKLFTTLLIVAGVAAVTYLFSAISHHVVSGELHGTLRRRQMQRKIDTLSNHFIVCGYGQVGAQVVESLRQRGKTCVVIETTEKDPGNPEVPVIIGNAEDDEILKQAGIERAEGLVAATGDDASNLFITVSAHTLNKDLTIVARANSSASEAKLQYGGATHVISPHIMGGKRIATQLLHPSVTDFLDVVMHSGDLELWLEEFTLSAMCDLEGKTVAESQVRQRTGANILAIRRRDGGSVLTNPPAELRFAPGDVLIALGTRQQLKDLSVLSTA